MHWGGDVALGGRIAGTKLRRQPSGFGIWWFEQNKTERKVTIYSYKNITCTGLNRMDHKSRKETRV